MQRKYIQVLCTLHPISLNSYIFWAVWYQNQGIDIDIDMMCKYSSLSFDPIMWIGKSTTLVKIQNYFAMPEISLVLPLLRTTPFKSSCEFICQQNC